jgi:hypothetical protein
MLQAFWDKTLLPAEVLATGVEIMLVVMHVYITEQHNNTALKLCTEHGIEHILYVPNHYILYA